MKEELSSSSSDTSSMINLPQSEPRRRSTKSRTSNRVSKAATTTTPSKPTMQEEKSEEVAMPTPPISNGDGESDHFQSNVDDFRQYVKHILDSPNKMDLPKPRLISPSPRIDRITIQHQKDQQMEFLIPPKKQEEPIEMREKIRAILSPDGTSPMEPSEIAKSKSPSLPFDGTPRYDETTRLWSPNVPNYDEEKAERVSRLLLAVIFTILTAVLIATFQEDIIGFLNKECLPMVQSGTQALRGYCETAFSQISSIWSSILSGSASPAESTEDQVVAE